uniref:Uncharacterized protein n=1 Tax=Aegilops tauschii subsp. strangulata TaxID=200361 RepID=A0A452XQK6_AEGTS
MMEGKLLDPLGWSHQVHVPENRHVVGVQPNLRGLGRSTSARTLFRTCSSSGKGQRCCCSCYFKLPVLYREAGAPHQGPAIGHMWSP